MARPVTYTKEVLDKISKQIRKYTEETEIPIVAEFCYMNDIRKQTLYAHPELSDSIKYLIDKKEAQLERKCLAGEISNSMAIFSLKQLGWTDKQEIEHSGQGQLVIVRGNKPTT